jgi:malonyl-CoA O-methyltransferase
MLDKEEIKRNFSRSARAYDRHAGLQQAMADKLIGLLPALQPRRVLDIGCGTGYLTGKLAAKFTAAAVLGIDLAPGMIAVARRHEGQRLRFDVADGEELKGPREYDLVVSNAALQWMDAARVFNAVAPILKPGGCLAFSTFGPRTLAELRTSGFRVNSFRPAEELKAAAGNKFSRITLTAEIVKTEFPSVKELLYHLKELGANNPQTEQRADRWAFRRHKERFGVAAAPATFEIIYGLLFAVN